jgi:hypothetical protein
MLEICVDEVALGQVFSPEYFGFPLSISFNRCSITRKNKKKKLFVFVTGLYNKPQGCGASVVSAAGPLKKVIQKVALVPDVWKVRSRFQIRRL